MKKNKKMDITLLKELIEKDRHAFIKYFVEKSSSYSELNRIAKAYLRVRKDIEFNIESRYFNGNIGTHSVEFEEDIFNVFAKIHIHIKEGTKVVDIQEYTICLCYEAI